MANKQYRLTEAEWHFIQEMRDMDMEGILDIVIALRSEVRELEKKAELVREKQREYWEQEYEQVQKRIDQLRQFEQEIRNTWPQE
jgi:DNA-binding PadR family transcriptional regulator